MSLTAIIDSINVNSEAAGIVVEGEADFGEAVFTEVGEKKASVGERTTAADRRPRIAVLNLRFEGTSEATRDALYNSVKAALEESDPADPTGVLEHNPGGWTANRYLDFYRGTSKIKTTETVAGHFNFIRRATVELVCKPFARKAAVDLPRNYVIDPEAVTDHNDDGIANSFTDNDTTITTVKAIDGGQKISRSGAETSGDVGGVKQVMTDIDGGEVWSYRIEYKCDAATSAEYNIYILYNDGGATKHYLLQSRTAVQAGWTEAILDNQTVPAGATQGTLVFEIKATATAAIAAALWCRDAMAVNAAAIPRGKDTDAALFYGSQWSATPVDLVKITNVPGDAGAELTAQVGTMSAHINSNGQDHIIMGFSQREPSQFTGYFGGVVGAAQYYLFNCLDDVNADSLGGKDSLVTDQPYTANDIVGGDDIYSLELPPGRYYIFGRLRCQAAEYATAKPYLVIQSMIGGAYNTYESKLYRTEPALWFTQQNKWTFGCFGSVDLPLDRAVRGVDYGYAVSVGCTVSLTTYGLRGDWIAFVPIDSMLLRGEVGDSQDYTDYITIALDSQTPDSYALGRIGAETESISWPLNESDLYPLGPSDRVLVDKPYLAENNYGNLICANYINSATEQEDNNGAYLALSYTPLYL